ncbi:MAG TPA: hypothetical protein GXZ47_07570 [Treponema sp.]|nr:hypothetical protein [Treponema sp.]
MILGPYYIVALVFVGIFLLVFAYGIFSAAPTQRKKTKKKAAAGPSVGRCPLCSSPLAPGEQIKSAIFPGETDRLCHIFGCPHCHPFIEDNLRRSCPVCGKTAPPDVYLIARMFDRPGKKKHIHILGCTNCRLPRTKK